MIVLLSSFVLFLLFRRFANKCTRQPNNDVNNNNDNNLDEQNTTREKKRLQIEEQLIVRRVLAETKEDGASSPNTSSRELPMMTSFERSQGSLRSFFSQCSTSNRSINFSEPLKGARDSSSSKDDVESQELTNNTNTLQKQSRPKPNIVARFLSQSFRSNNRRDTCCDICLGEYEHGFHKECIVDWLMENNSCPICRRDYVEV